MGKGIALMFKEAFPENFRAYEKACKAREVEVGRMFVTERDDLMGPRWIINFPTKQHWRSKTRLAWIDEGLMDLKRVIVDKEIRSIAGSVDLGSSTLEIGGSVVPYAVELTNPTGATLSIVVLQGWIQQGTTERAAGGTQVLGCGTNSGELDPGTCTPGANLSASNTGGGSGTLVAGPATARIELRLNNVVIDEFFANITLN